MTEAGTTRSLVTGGAGFIGQHLVRALGEEGGFVRSLDIIDHPELPAGAEAIRGSILDDASLAAAMENVDTVFHTAANAHLWAKDKSSFDVINHQGTRKTLDAARKAGVKKFVYVSSLTVLVGKHMGRAPVTVTEKQRLTADEMLGPYPKSKWLGEKAALETNGEDFHVVSVLPTLPVGPGDHGLTAPTRMIVDVVNGRIPAFLDCIHNIVDVRDIASGMIAARDHGMPGERYLLGNENMTMAQLLEQLHVLTGLRMPSIRAPYPVAYMAGMMAEWMADAMTGRAPQAPLTGVRLAGRRVHFNSDKARNDLGFIPRSAETALRDALIWARDAGHIVRTMPELEA